MLRCGSRVLIFFLFVAVFASASPIPQDSQKLTKVEEEEAHELAVRFIIELAGAKDLSSVVQHLYVDNFIQRFNEYKLKHPDSNFDLYFIPGLEYDRALLAQGTTEDWRRFYTSANNLIFYGVVSAFRKAPTKEEDISVSDLYPQQVVQLLNKNANLANVIERKGRGKVISSIEELRAATNTFQQAVAIMRENVPVKPLERKELVKVMNDDMFKPQVEVINDEEFFGFPRNSRFIFMKTPILFFLMFVRDNHQLKIVYAIPFAG